MSIRTIKELRCPGCGARHAFETWESINVTGHPELKEKLLTGDLAVFTCPGCQWQGEVGFPLLYHDMEQQFMIWLRQDGSDPTCGMEQEMKDYRLRVVQAWSELVEKILIFDSGYDDRAMEFLKATMRAQCTDPGRPLDGKLRFRPCEPDEAPAQFYLRHFQGSGLETITVPTDTYRDLERLIAPLLAVVDQEESNRWLRVDQQYATSLVKRYGHTPTYRIS